LETLVGKRELKFSSNEYPFAKQGEGLFNALKCLTKESSKDEPQDTKTTCPKHGKYILCF